MAASREVNNAIRFSFGAAPPDVIMRKLIVLAIFIVLIMCGIYGGLVIYGNVKAMNESNYSIPDSSEARYGITIKNTGNYLLSNNIEQLDNIVILHGYWELNGQKFVYRDSDLILDSHIFGEIGVKKR